MIVERLLNTPTDNHIKHLPSERIFSVYGLSDEECCYLDSLNL